MGENPQHITEFLDSLFSQGALWVYLMLFAACFIENIFAPFPGDSFIVAAGGLVAFERLDLSLACILMIAGGMSSVMILHYVGRRFGRDFFLRKNFKLVSANDIIKVESHFRKWGALILVISRFVVGMRVVIAVTAGMGKYNTARMFVYSTISYIMFVGLLMYLGMKLAENFDRIAYYVKTYNTIVWPIVIILVVTYVVHKLRRLRRKI